MTRYLIALLLGIAAGAAAFLALLYFNPFTSQDNVSPLSVGSNQVMNLTFSPAASDSLVYTNNGETRIKPHPEKVLHLWEATVRRTTAAAKVLYDGRGRMAGVGVKFSSDSEATRLMNGEALVESVWHIYLPGRGTLFVEQNENYWSYLREIVIPAYWSSADSWKGNWHGTVTAGPGVLGLGRVVGGSGEFADFESNVTESITARAYSVDLGPVAADSNLTIELPLRVGQEVIAED